MTVQPLSARVGVLVLSLMLPGVLANAADLPTWEVPAPRMLQESYFSNLDDGASIETPFLLKFGLVGMGLAGLDKPVPGTGHHHLLVNRDLPLNFKQPLPFNDQYIHFGKGQMEAVLSFEPGRYRLQLVMADDKHIPDFVYSKAINITVTRHNKSVDPTSLVQRGVAILSPAEGATVRRPFRLAFHASGLNVSSVALGGTGRGHFRVRVESAPGRGETLDLTGGHTEIWLQPPPGRYVAKLEFVENSAAATVLATATPVSFSVD